MTTGIDPGLRKEVQATLRRLGIRIFNMVFDGNYELAGTAIYFAEKNFSFRRICVLQNLCPALSRKDLTPISIEISLAPNIAAPDPEEQFKTILKQLAQIPQFAQLGLPIDYEVLEIDFAYPMQTNGLRDLVRRVHEQYAKYGVLHCGRGGNFDYCNSDMAYLQGKKVVREIVV
jgi:hypothetical protein